MFNKLLFYFNLAMTNFEKIFVTGLIMVSAIIVVIGVLKICFFNKIKNKLLRKSLLAFTNVASCFVTTVGYFLVEELNFNYFWFSAICLSVFSILVYWIYENTCLRNLIEKIGKLAIKKLSSVGIQLFTTDEKIALEKELKVVVDEIETQVKKELKQTIKATKQDQELKNL